MTQKKKLKSPQKAYNDYIYAQTKKYQKNYGFEIGNGEHDAWNNEADAFKHTYMSADMALRANAKISKYFGDKHEEYGSKSMGQSKGEDNMDRWNNAEGRKIAQKIAKEIGNFGEIKKQAWNLQLEDRIAKEVKYKMQKGDLITNPTDPRRYVEPKDTRTINQKFSDKIRSEYQRAKNEKLQKIFGKSKSANSANIGGGRWVTINGHHVYLD